MSRRVLGLHRPRRYRRDQPDPGQVVPRDEQADWDWAWVRERQLARVPSGRLVTAYVAFEASVCVLRPGDDGG